MMDSRWQDRKNTSVTLPADESLTPGPSARSAMDNVFDTGQSARIFRTLTGNLTRASKADYPGSQRAHLVRVRSVETGQIAAELVRRPFSISTATLNFNFKTHKNARQASFSKKEKKITINDTYYPTEIIDAIVTLILLDRSIVVQTFAAGSSSSSRAPFLLIENFSLVCRRFRQVALRQYFSSLWVSSAQRLEKCLDIPGTVNWVRLVPLRPPLLILLLPAISPRFGIRVFGRKICLYALICVFDRNARYTGP